MNQPSDDREAMAARYARRGAPERYSFLQPDVWQSVQERQRAMLGFFTRAGWTSLSDKRAVEVGCGAGGNLQELLRLGFMPERLTGIELLPDRAAHARQVLPVALRLIEGDARQVPIEAGSQDLVLQATVFSSLQSHQTRSELAAAMWRWLAPGGAVLWYDLRVDNPRNPDVRGVPLAELRALFPQARVAARRVTLAPPLARAACRLHPRLYPLLNAMPPLRTHMLAWIEKPS
ncbi:MAG: class I SAM-dependent methyltransferase [Burkholderiaceae bacterium]|nr:class I SAM-dependent methyltransferase [Burkholderiaceae bacterium]